MIAYVRGRVDWIGENSVVVEAGGIGYEIYMTGAALSRLSVDREVKIQTYFQVREDAMQLFGFLSRDELEVFRLLLGVSGIGPKAALGILGSIAPDDLRFAVLSDDVKTIQAAPGVGKKTAQKLILELKDKFRLEDAFEHKLEASLTSEELPEDLEDSRKEAILALAALGYGRTEAARAVGKVEGAAGLSVEEILKKALKYMV